MSKYCPKCGRELPDNAEFCDNCGYQLPKQKSGAGSILVKAIAVLAVLGIIFFGGIMLWTRLHYNPALDGDVYPGPSASVSATAESSAVMPAVTPAPTPAPTQTPTQTPTPTPTPTPAAIPVPSAGDAETASPAPAANTPAAAAPAPQESSQSDYNTANLHFEDFDFYQDYVYEGFPDGAERIALKNANGDWKYNIAIANGTDGNSFSEIGFAECYVNGSDNPPVKMTLHPRFANDGYETWTETDEEVGYEPFAGGLDENDELKLTGNNCVLVLNDYYFCEGREYMIGTLWMSEESMGSFLMTRGQE